MSVLRGQSAAKEHAVQRAANVFKIFAENARLNQRAMSNRALAKRLHSSHGAIDNAVNFLVANGMIEVETKNNHRRIFVVRDGRWTL